MKVKIIAKFRYVRLVSIGQKKIYQVQCRNLLKWERAYIGITNDDRLALNSDMMTYNRQRLYLFHILTYRMMCGYKRKQLLRKIGSENG